MTRAVPSRLSFAPSSRPSQASPLESAKDGFAVSFAQLCPPLFAHLDSTPIGNNVAKQRNKREILCAYSDVGT